MLIRTTHNLIANLERLADDSPRNRMAKPFSEHSEKVQRMINCFRVDSYSRPHRHSDPEKVEVFIILTGRLGIVAFDDDGNIIDQVIIDESGPVYAVEVPRGVWHMIIGLSEYATAYEVIEGPYTATSHKDFAHWSPLEDDIEAGQEFLGMIKEKMGINLAKILAKNDLFSYLSNRQIQEVIDLGVVKEYDKDEVIFRQNDPGETMYIIAEGIVQISVEKNGESIPVAQLSEGSILGEIAVLDGSPRSASASTIKPVSLVEINRDDFFSLVNKSPGFAIAIIQLVSKRLKALNELNN